MYSTPIRPDELYHHGRLGQKWGDRNGPPYPLSRGQLSSGGYIQKRRAKKAAIALNKKRSESLQKARETRAAKKQHEEEKQKALKEGSATDVNKFISELSNKELSDAVYRIELTQKLSSLSQKELKTKMDKIDDIMKDIKTVTNWAKIGTDTWNTMASIYNITDEGKKNPWPIINTGGGGDKKKK